MMLSPQIGGERESASEFSVPLVLHICTHGEVIVGVGGRVIEFEPE
jgi:hypothetical protein